ncbi:hypothetical protein SCB49_11292 [unidentified eubacterium SCB49]|nr:hypothetical protein SCB49_11292 [unidentified eubacterium SCB49]
MKTGALLLLTFIICASCSTSKTTPTQWQSEAFKNQKIDRMLVYASTKDRVLQEDFEDRVSEVLISEEISPIKMHELFPDIEYKDKRSEEEIKKLILECRKQNIDKVLIASQKAMRIDTVYAKSLHNYFNTLEPLKLNGKSNDELEYKTKKLTTYTIEAAVYDIAVSSEDKPIAATTLKVTDPKSLDKIEADFLIAIKKLFKNK